MREKTKLEKYLDLYFKMFEENYPLTRTSEMTEEAHIERIKRCIATETKAPEPDYDAEEVY